MIGDITMKIADVNAILFSVNAIIFDMDGVLIDSERMISECWKKVAEYHNILNIDAAINGCVGLNKTDTKLFFHKLYGDDFLFDKFNEETSSMFKNEISEHGLPMKPGVIEILSYLKEQKIPIGLASSTRLESVKKHMKQLGLFDYFQIIIGGDMVVHSKPDPEIYSIACKKIGQKPSLCIAIEDSPNGIRSAVAAGMKAVMIPDLIQPTPDISQILMNKYDSLNDFLCEIQKDN